MFNIPDAAFLQKHKEKFSPKNLLAILNLIQDLPKQLFLIKFRKTSRLIFAIFHNPIQT